MYIIIDIGTSLMFVHSCFAFKMFLPNKPWQGFGYCAKTQSIQNSYRCKYRQLFNASNIDNLSVIFNNKINQHKRIDESIYQSYIIPGINAKNFSFTLVFLNILTRISWQLKCSSILSRSQLFTFFKWKSKLLFIFKLNLYQIA